MPLTADLLTHNKETVEPSIPVNNIVSPNIIQLLMAPNDATWQGVLLGLGNDGVTYVCGKSGRWEPYIPPLGYAG